MTRPMSTPLCLHAQLCASHRFAAGTLEGVRSGMSGLAMIRNAGVRTANTSMSDQQSGVRSANTTLVVQRRPSAIPVNRSLT
jgi:hypothetical protein